MKILIKLCDHFCKRAQFYDEDAELIGGAINNTINLILANLHQTLQQNSKEWEEKFKLSNTYRDFGEIVYNISSIFSDLEIREISFSIKSASDDILYIGNNLSSAKKEFIMKKIKSFSYIDDITSSLINIFSELEQLVFSLNENYNDVLNKLSESLYLISEIFYKFGDSNISIKLKNLSKSALDFKIEKSKEQKIEELEEQLQYEIDTGDDTTIEALEEMIAKLKGEL